MLLIFGLGNLLPVVIQGEPTQFVWDSYKFDVEQAAKQVSVNAGKHLTETSIFVSTVWLSMKEYAWTVHNSKKTEGEGGQINLGNVTYEEGEEYAKNLEEEKKTKEGSEPLIFGQDNTQTTEPEYKSTVTEPETPTNITTESTEPASTKNITAESTEPESTKNITVAPTEPQITKNTTAVTTAILKLPQISPCQLPQKASHEH